MYRRAVVEKNILVMGKVRKGVSMNFHKREPFSETFKNTIDWLNTNNKDSGQICKCGKYYETEMEAWLCCEALPGTKVVLEGLVRSCRDGEACVVTGPCPFGHGPETGSREWVLVSECTNALERCEGITLLDWAKVLRYGVPDDLE